MISDEFKTYHTLVEAVNQGYEPRSEILKAFTKFEDQIVDLFDFKNEYKKLLNRESFKKVTEYDVMDAIEEVLKKKSKPVISSEEDSKINNKTKIKDGKHIISQDMTVINFHEINWSYNILPVDGLFQIILKDCNNEDSLYSLGIYKKEELEKVISNIKFFSVNSDSILIMPPTEEKETVLVPQVDEKAPEIVAVKTKDSEVQES